MNTISLPLFPLSNHVLSGGILPLRIFESRYLRMIKESYQRDVAFGMCMLNANGNEQDHSHIYPVGTLIEIIDFEKLSDGQLGITVKGIRPFTIKSIHKEADELYVGEVEFRKNWPEQALTGEYQYLVDKLQELYLNYPDLAALYTEPEWHNASWIASRWLEVLPLAPKEKQKLLLHKTADNCLAFLKNSIQANS